MSRRKSDLWALRSGDLPSARMLGPSSDLHGIGDNAIYRSVLYEQHKRSSWFRLHPALRGLILAGGILLFSLFLSSLLPLLLIGYALSRSRRRTPASHLRIPDALLNDLADAPLMPRDWTLAFWAFAMTRMGRSAAPYAILIYLVSTLLLLAGAAVAGDFPPEASSSVGAIAGFATGMLPFTLWPPAESYLPSLATRIRQIRRLILPIRNIFVRIVRTLALLFFLFVSVFIIGAFLGMAIGLIANHPGSAAMGDALRRWLVHPAAPYVHFISGAGASAAILGLRRSWVRNRREKFLDRIDAEMALILDEVRARRDPAVGRAARSRKIAASIPRPVSVSDAGGEWT